MSRILIMSDSHGLRDEIHTIKNRHRLPAMIHCGDSELDEDSDELSEFIKVAGNCDRDTRFRDEALHRVEGRIFFVTHGHLNQVKSTLLPLTYRAKEVNADIVCFGHTHIAGAEKIDDKLFINPGSIRYPKGKYGKTYAVVTFHGQAETEVTFYTLDGKEVDELTLQTTLKGS